MSRRYRLPFRVVNGFAGRASPGGSLDVISVRRPLDPDPVAVVLSDMLLERPAMYSTLPLARPPPAASPTATAFLAVL